MIETVFEELRGIGAVRSSDEFSTKWLGRERSYLRGLRAKQRNPSPTVLATCAVRLLRTADSFSAMRAMPTLDKHKQLRVLANRCLEQILAEGARR